MIQTIRKAWGIPELRKKILFTLLILVIYRVGSAIPVPYVNVDALKFYLDNMGTTILGLYNVMSGGAFASATVFAMGIQPYINSSIIIQLLTVAIPALERMQREGGEEGKRKIQSITRYSTVAIAVLQALGYYFIMKSQGILTDQSIWAALVIMVSFVAGSSFLMWLGEQITEFGIGNGISIILFAGIVARGPSMVGSMIEGVRGWIAKSDPKNYLVLHPAFILLIVAGMLLLVAFIVFMDNSERRIPVQYAKRVVGRKMYGGQSSHLPIKVNMSGVLPIIFAQSIASIPATIGMFVPSAQTPGSGWYTFLQVFDSRGWVYCIVYFLLIVFFSYFYNTIQFNPIEVSNNLKKNGGFIPGQAHQRLPQQGGVPHHHVRRALPGCGGPAAHPRRQHYAAGGKQRGPEPGIGGTSVIIVVGVALETVKALEAQLMMRHYKGFLE